VGRGLQLVAHGGDQSIAEAMDHGQALSRVVTKLPSEATDTLSQAVVGDPTTGPTCVEQLVLCAHFARIQGQMPQNLVSTAVQCVLDAGLTPQCAPRLNQTIAIQPPEALTGVRE
jgi:hypothetical protein